MDLFDESLRPGSFDAVVACNVLLYLENRAEVLARIRELLRPEGMFLSATDCLGERSHARVFASGGAATQGKCPMCRLTVCTRWRRPSPRLALRCWRPKTCFPRRRTSLSQQEKVNEHRSADQRPALLLRSDEVFVDDGDPAQQRGDQKGQRADEQRQKRHGEKALQESVLTPRN